MGNPTGQDTGNSWTICFWWSQGFYLLPPPPNPSPAGAGAQHSHVPSCCHRQGLARKRFCTKITLLICYFALKKNKLKRDCCNLQTHMKELHGIQAQLTGRCKPKDLVPICASARRFSFPLPRSSSSSHDPPGTHKGQLLQVKAPAVVRWLKKLAHPLAGFTGKASPCWSLGLQNTLMVPLLLGWGSCTSLESSGSTSGDRQDRDTGTFLPLVTSHRCTASPCSSVPMEEPWLPLWPGRAPAWLAQQPNRFAFM